MRIIKIVVSSILLAITTGLAVAQTNPYSEYYRHLVFRESPFSQHKGIYPIKEKDAENIAHYRFDYDENGSVIEISHRIGDDLIAFNGNWDSFTWWVPKIAIDYEEQREIVTFYNHLNEEAPVYGNVSHAVIELDEDARRIAMRFLINGEPAENHWNVHRYEWEHSEDGVVIERRFNLQNEPATLRPNLTFYTVKLIFGDDDMLDFMHHIDENGELVNNTLGAAIDRIVYDEDGNFIRWMVFDEERALAEGNAPQLALGENLYDEFGNKIGLRGYNVFMEPKAMPGGAAYVWRKYDRFGNLVEEAYHDINKNVIIKDVAEFSEDGKRRVAREFRNGEDETVNHQGIGFAREEYQYSEKGELTERKQFTADGNIIERTEDL